jgi:hypothetical protein
LNIREVFETTKGSKLEIFAHKIMNGDAYAKEKFHDFVCASFEFKNQNFGMLQSLGNIQILCQSTSIPHLS